MSGRGAPCPGLKIFFRKNYLSFDANFQTQIIVRTQHLWGGFRVSKARSTCHYVEISKIQEMKSISKPRLDTKIYTF